MLATISFSNLYYFQITEMSKYKHREGIRIDDCPPGKAPVYPGKKNKNNKNGSDLSSSEWVDKVIGDWVTHFKDNEKYEETRGITK